MTQTELFDPLTGPACGWPETAKAERAYLEEFCRLGSGALIANLRTSVLGLWHDGFILPITVNEAEYGDSYVCLPHTAYALYAKAELDIVNAGQWTPILRKLADAAGVLLRLARVNRIVHIDNWMLSTNLHGQFTGENLVAIRVLLSQKFPKHFLAIRSVNHWSDPSLLSRLQADGWKLLAARQIYVNDDLAREWLPKRDTRQDRRLLAETSYAFDEMRTLRPGDPERIAKLYGLLYLDRYSNLNPAFTPKFITLTHHKKIFHYAGLRASNGDLVAIVGCLIREGILTTPILGYDTARPQGEGLYRLASVLLAQLALRHGARLNSSAGAAGFKRLRGARPVIEYTAYFAGHLPWPRRAAISTLGALLDHVAVPFIQRRAL